MEDEINDQHDRKNKQGKFDFILHEEPFGVLAVVNYEIAFRALNF